MYTIEKFLGMDGTTKDYYRVMPSVWSPVSRGIDFADKFKEEMLKQINSTKD